MQIFCFTMQDFKGFRSLILKTFFSVPFRQKRKAFTETESNSLICHEKVNYSKIIVLTSPVPAYKIKSVLSENAPMVLNGF